MTDIIALHASTVDALRARCKTTFFLLPFVLAFTACGIERRPETAAPWAKQLTVATQFAQRGAPDIVLMQAGASPVDGKNDTLKVRFVFFRPSGELINISLEDTAVESTVQRSKATGQINPAPTSTEQEALKRALTTVRLSPSDVLRLTSGDGNTFFEEQAVQADNRDVNIGLNMRPEVETEFRIPAVWRVTFSKIYSDRVESLIVTVNAQTGDILRRETRVL